MKRFVLACLLITSTSMLFVGCETTHSGSSTSRKTAIKGPAVAGASKFTATDKRVIKIGKATAQDGGRAFKNPHFSKCWVADGFNFTGYDTLYIAPIDCTAQYEKDEEFPLRSAKNQLAYELAGAIARNQVFPRVVIAESDLKRGARVLKLENTIVEYAKGNASRLISIWLGQPKLRVRGKIVEAGKTVFEFEGFRSASTEEARQNGDNMTEAEVQLADIRDLDQDLTDFMAAISGKYQPKD